MSDQYKVATPEIEEKATLTADPKLALKPVKTLRAIVTGNGIDPRSVTLGEQTIKTILFSGFTRIKLEAKTTKTVQPGKDVTGEAVSDQQALYAGVQNHLRALTSTPKTRERIVETLLKRPDKGFGTQEIKTGFHEFEKNFVLRQPCTRCNHTGKTVCTACQGKKRIMCHACRGQQEIPCPKCRGSGAERDGSACKQCGGRRRIRCTYCGGDGLLECKPCIASGLIRCETCGGSAWSSTVLSVKVEAQIGFSLDRPETLPPDLIRIINELESKLITRAIAEIEVSRVLTHVENKKIPTDEILILYKGRIPFGPVRFAVNGESVGATLYGYHGELVSCPNFLERWEKDTINHLKNAAEDRKEARNLLPQVRKLRFIREALQASLMVSRKKALELYARRYPYGLSEPMMKNLMTWSDTALLNASATERLYGVLGALALVMILSGAYYGTAAHTLFKTHQESYAAELFLMFALMALAYIVPRILGAFALRRLLGGTITMQKIAGLMPRTGIMEWTAIAAAPVLMTGMAVFLALVVQVHPPAWLVPILVALTG